MKRCLLLAALFAGAVLSSLTLARTFVARQKVARAVGLATARMQAANHLDELWDTSVGRWTLWDLSGQTWQIPSAQGHYQLLVLFGADCESCLGGVEEGEIVRHSEPASRLDVIGLSTDPAPALRDFQHRQGLPYPICHVSPALFERCRAYRTPTFVIVDPQGRVRFTQAGVSYMDGCLRVQQKVEMLLKGAVVWATASAEPMPGTRAPEVYLQGVNGRRIRLSDLAGNAWLILFVSRYCSGCDTTAAPLSRLLQRDPNKVRVLLVAESAGSPGGAARYLSAWMSALSGMPAVRLTKAADIASITQAQLRTSLPTAMLIDGRGAVLALAQGTRAAALVRRVARPSLPESPTRPTA